jgi:hypothetical protein
MGNRTAVSFDVGEAARIVNRFVPDLAFFAENQFGTSWNRVPGDAKPSWKWSTAMRTAASSVPYSAKSPRASVLGWGVLRNGRAVSRSQRVPRNRLPVPRTLFPSRRSSKEGDSSFRPYSHRPNKTDWPTIVIESGVSETLPHLRFDTSWWLRESKGDVKIIIIISIKRARPMIQIEKWELASIVGGQLTLRSASNNAQIPTKTQEITIDPNAVTGAPLILEFEKILLRPAVLPETDIAFSAQELSTWAARIW